MIQVKVYNNLLRKKVPLTLLNSGEVKFYSCGPTTYDFLHIGNGRALVIGDIFHRILKVIGLKVTFVRNFTDVDDKIIDQAKKRGVDPLKHSAEFVSECLEDMERLNMKPATHTPKVSETMPEIIKMIETLISKKFAYVSNGEVLYHVPSFKDYGKLSKKDLESLEHGIRVSVESHKKHPSDFVLWKPAKADEPAWDSPWSKGRPGWHIECSAMAKKFLGDTIDLHHGGVDLMFPHHENEIAQSEAANGCEFSKCWCHHEFLNMGQEKMSKSLGNVVTIRAFTEKFNGMVLRQMLLSVHYRSKMEWGVEAINQAIVDIERIHHFILNFSEASKHQRDIGMREDYTKALEEIRQKILEELANDFNIPGAMGHYFSLIRDINRDYLNTKTKITADVIVEIEKINSLVKEATGLIYDNPSLVLTSMNDCKKVLAVDSGSKGDDSEILKLLEERKEARAKKDYKKSDEIRARLNELKVVVKDNPDGTVSWNYSAG